MLKWKKRLQKKALDGCPKPLLYMVCKGKVFIVESSQNAFSKPHVSPSPNLSFDMHFQNNAYVLQNDEDEAHIELYDMVADPKFFTGADPHQDHLPKMIPNHPQPDLRQVVGLRNTLTCCVLPNRQYGKLDNEYMDHSMDTSGGTAFIVLNPRRLNGHATIPAPPMPCPSALAAHHSKWSINSANSLEDHERSHHAPSIDLEWENDGRLENFF